MFKLFQLKLAPRLANLKTFSLLCVCSVLVSADILPLCGYRGPKQTPVAFEADTCSLSQSLSNLIY